MKKASFELRELLPGARSALRGNAQTGRVFRMRRATRDAPTTGDREATHKLRVDPVAVNDLEAALAGCLCPHIVSDD